MNGVGSRPTFQILESLAPCIVPLALLSLAGWAGGQMHHVVHTAARLTHFVPIRDARVHRFDVCSHSGRVSVFPLDKSSSTTMS
jgi:hypothetical protein